MRGGTELGRRELERIGKEGEREMRESERGGRVREERE